jgi:hypothetical protein
MRLQLFLFWGVSAYNVSRSLFFMLQRLIHLQHNVRVHAQKTICVTIVATIAKAANFLIAHNIGGLVVFQMFNNVQFGRCDFHSIYNLSSFLRHSCQTCLFHRAYYV